MLLLLIPLCVSIVEGDDVGKFELCIEFVSEFLYARDAEDVCQKKKSKIKRNCQFPSKIASKFAI